MSKRPALCIHGRPALSVLFLKGDKTYPTLIFPVTMYGRESWTVKKAGRKNGIHLKQGAGGEFYRCLGPLER